MNEENNINSEFEEKSPPVESEISQSTPNSIKPPFPTKLVFIIAFISAIVVIGIIALLPKTPSNASCNHQWIEADCLYPQTCRICHQTQGAALGHSVVIDKALAPTCTNTGLTEGAHCSICDKVVVEQEVVDTLEHNWGNPTCTTPRSCCDCFTVDPNSEPNGHSYMDGECIICGADDPEYIALTLTSTKYDINLEENSDIAYITMIGGETVTYDIDDTSVVRCEWGEWDGDVIPLIFHPVSNGQTFVTIYIDNTNIKIVIDITVDSQQNKKLQQMSALGIETAYNSAKFPSTLRLSRVTYEDRINGYGDPITRMVIECYATNSFGGYGYIYVVVLCCEYETDYINLEWDGSYFSTSAYSNSPGLCDYTLDNEIAMTAYKNLIDNPKEIPYD